MSSVHIQDIFKWVGVIGTVIGGFLWVWKKLGKPLLSYIREYENMKKRLVRVDELEKRIAYEASKINSIIYLAYQPMFVCSEDGMCVLANIAICELFGTTERQMRGRGWLNFIHKEDRKTAQKDFEHAIIDGSEDVTNQYRIIHAGSKETISVTYHLIIARDQLRKIVIAVGRMKKDGQ